MDDSFVQRCPTNSAKIVFIHKDSYKNGIASQLGQRNDRESEVFASAVSDNIFVLFQQLPDGCPFAEPVGGIASIEDFAEFVLVFLEQFSSEESAGDFD